MCVYACLLATIYFKFESQLWIMQYLMFTEHMHLECDNYGLTVCPLRWDTVVKLANFKCKFSLKSKRWFLWRFGNAGWGPELFIVVFKHRCGHQQDCSETADSRESSSKCETQYLLTILLPVTVHVLHILTLISLVDNRHFNSSPFESYTVILSKAQALISF